MGQLPLYNSLYYQVKANWQIIMMEMNSSGFKKDSVFICRFNSSSVPDALNSCSSAVMLTPFSPPPNLQHWLHILLFMDDSILWLKKVLREDFHHKWMLITRRYWYLSRKEEKKLKKRSFNSFLWKKINKSIFFSGKFSISESNQNVEYNRKYNCWNEWKAIFSVRATCPGYKTGNQKV